MEVLKQGRAYKKGAADQQMDGWRACRDSNSGFHLRRVA